MWHDPVWSKVISWAIIGVLTIVAGAITFFVAWAWSGFSSSLSVIWATLLSVLSQPTSFPLGVVLLTLLATAALAWWFYTNSKRELRASEEKRAKESAAEAELVKQVQAQLQQMRSEQAQREAEAQDKKAKPSFVTVQRSDKTVEALKNAFARSLPARQDLEDSEVRFLRALYRAYDSPVGLRATAAPMSYPGAERMAEKLEKAGLVKIIPATRFSEANVVLTKIGRDYCYENDVR
jgi:membrane protein implicated in regulation of membrane protease activity